MARASGNEEGPFVKLIMNSGIDAEQVMPNGLSRADRGPPDNPAVGFRSFGGQGMGTTRQTARGLKGGE